MFQTRSLFPSGKNQIDMTLDAVPILESQAFQNRLRIKVQISFQGFSKHWKKARITQHMQKQERMNKLEEDWNGKGSLLQYLKTC